MRAAGGRENKGEKQRKAGRAGERAVVRQGGRQGGREEETSYGLLGRAQRSGTVIQWRNEFLNDATCNQTNAEAVSQNLPSFFEWNGKTAA